MAAEGIKVSTQVLFDTASKVRTINKNLDDKLTEINKQMNELEGTWKSDASDAIRGNMNALKPRFAQYKEVIESYCKFLDSTAQSYESTESAIQTNANQFK